MRKERGTMNGVKKDTVVVVEIGQPVTANERAEDFNLTEGRQYTVLGYDGDILVKNDLGKEEFYSKDYFYEYQGLYGL